MDSIDSSLVEFNHEGHTHISSHSHQWPYELQQQLRTLTRPGDNEVEQLGILDARVAEEFAQCVKNLLNKTGYNPNQVIAIGSHGQTIRHMPDAVPPFTIQIGDPNRIAELTGITTVADFRRRDMAAGGQGAPLVCAFHEAIFHDKNEDRIILNLGGIANITILPGDSKKPVSGLDTGPGNTLMDAWIRRHLGEQYDESGSWAAGGTVEHSLLAVMLEDDYLHRPPPKSTGPEHFNLKWLDSILDGFPQIDPQDVQATLVQFSATTIAKSIQIGTVRCDRVIVCGGGAHNRELMTRLHEELKDIPIENSADYGVDPNNVEAIAFAWLARQTLLGLTGNIPEVTGASGPRVLGGIYSA